METLLLVTLDDSRLLHTAEMAVVRCQILMRPEVRVVFRCSWKKLSQPLDRWSLCITVNCRITHVRYMLMIYCMN